MDGVGQQWALRGWTGEGSTLGSLRCPGICLHGVIGLRPPPCWLLAGSQAQLLAMRPFIPSAVGAMEESGQRRGVVRCKRKGRVKMAVDFFSLFIIHFFHVTRTHAQKRWKPDPLGPEGPGRHLPTAGAQQIPAEERGEGDVSSTLLLLLV